jgi:hypothetical protein
MRFGPDLQILEGRNNNETNWRIRAGLLKLINSEGDIHSRFYYSHDDNRFFNTNDGDTVAIHRDRIRDQYMIPER